MVFRPGHGWPENPLGGVGRLVVPQMLFAGAVADGGGAPPGSPHSSPSPARLAVAPGFRLKFLFQSAILTDFGSACLRRGWVPALALGGVGLRRSFFDFIFDPFLGLGGAGIGW